MSRQPGKIDVTLQVHNEVEARELNEAWEEIVTGKKLVRTEALEQDVEAVMERARSALQTIETRFASTRRPARPAASCAFSPAFTTGAIFRSTLRTSGPSTPSSQTPVSTTSTTTGWESARCIITSPAAIANCTSG